MSTSPNGNQKDKVEASWAMVTGPLVGSNLLQKFKSEMIKEAVFRKMFGETGDSIFIDKVPNINETILPAVILQWSRETYTSNNVYLDGSVDGSIVLPTKLTGDYNALRRVANMVQRWMGGGMNLWSDVPGLTQFGHGTEFTFDKLAAFDGFRVPLITMRIPFRFDLQYLRLLTDGFDPSAPLDDSDVGFVEEYDLNFKNAENQNDITQGVKSVTGQTNT